MPLEENIKLVTKEYVDTIQVGKKTAEGGEIFNTYEGQGLNKAISEGSHAEGYGNIAGVNVFNIVSYTQSTSSYVLDSVEGLEVGDMYSIKWDNNYDLIGIITSIDTSMKSVIVSNFIPPNIGYENEGIFYIPAKPTIGTTSWGTGQHAEGQDSYAVGTQSHTEGHANVSAGRYSHTEGTLNIAGYSAHAEGRHNQALGRHSHAEGRKAVAKADETHSEGSYTVANGQASHSEGLGVYSNTDFKDKDGNPQGKASNEKYGAHGLASHIEGIGTYAKGEGAHAEGIGRDLQKQDNSEPYDGAPTNVGAVGRASHSEGYKTYAKHDYSHTEGKETISTREGSHSEGVYNNTYIFKAIPLAGEPRENSKVTITDVGLEWPKLNGNGDGLHQFVLNSTLTSNHNYLFEINILNSSKIELSNIQIAIFYWTDLPSKQGTYSTSSYSSKFSTILPGYNIVRINAIPIANHPYVSIRLFSDTALDTSLIIPQIRYIDLTQPQYNTNLIHSIGNGTTDSTRTNAFEVYMDGHAEVQTVGTTDNSVVTKKYVDNSIKQNNCKLAEAIITTARTSTNELIVTDVSSLCETGQIGVYSSTGELDQGTKEIIPTADPVRITTPISGYSQSIDPVTNISLVETNTYNFYGSLGVLFSNDTYLYVDGYDIDNPLSYRLLYFIDGDTLTYSYEIYSEELGTYVVKKSATVSGYKNLKIVAVYSNYESAITPKLYNCVEKITPLPNTTLSVSDGTTTQQYTTDTEGLVKNAQIYSPKTIISLHNRDLKTIISLTYNQNIQDYVDNGLKYKKNIVNVTSESVYGADTSGDVMIPISSSGESNTITKYDDDGVLRSKDPMPVYEESHKDQVVNIRYFENNNTVIRDRNSSVEITEDGPIYSVGVRISAESDNQLSLVEDGLRVKPSTSKIAYTVKLTEQPSSEEKKTYTADASYEMIKAAYDAGDIIKVRIVQDGDNSELPLMNASFNGNNAGFTFGYTQITTGGQLLSTRAINYLHTNTIDKWEDADDSTDLSTYISTAGGTINGNLDVTGQVKAQTIHVDGEAPIYVGSTNVADEKGARITGIVNENAAAVVVPNTQNTYANIYVAEPTNNSHSATKKYVDNSISDIKAKTKIDRLQYSDASILDINDVNSAKINCNITTQASTNQVYVYGKNILDNSKYITPKTINGVTITYLPDEDAYLLNGTVTSSYGFSIPLIDIGSIPLYVNGAKCVGYCQRLSGSLSDTSKWCTLEFTLSDLPSGPQVGGQHSTVQVGKTDVAYSKVTTLEHNYIRGISIFTQTEQTFNNLKVKLMLSLQNSLDFPYITYSAPVVYPIKNNTSYINIPESGALVGLNTVGTISGTADKVLINDVVYKDYQGISAMSISASKEYVDGLVGNINSVLATLVDVNTNTIQSDQPPESEENILSEPTVEGGLS